MPRIFTDAVCAKSGAAAAVSIRRRNGIAIDDSGLKQG
jgi:hypothetical protein